jgi:hypothetical protein
MELMRKKKSMELKEDTGRGQGHKTFSLTPLHKHCLKLMKRLMKGKRIIMITRTTKDRQLITLKIKYNHIN